MDRRRFLKAAAAAAAVPAVAGCTEEEGDVDLTPTDDDSGTESNNGESDDSGNNEGPSGDHIDREGVPEYARWMPADSVGTFEDGRLISYLNYRWVGELEELERDPFLDIGPEFGPEQGIEEVDPLFGTPVEGFTFLLTTIEFGLSAYAFAEALVDPTSEFDTDHILLMNDLFVFEGEYDPEAIVADAPGFEKSGESNGFDIYESEVESDNGDGDDDGSDKEPGDEDDDRELVGGEGLAFAVSEDAVVLMTSSEGLEDGRKHVETVIDAAEGEADSWMDVDENAREAFERSGHGQYVFAGWETGSLGEDDIDGEGAGMFDPSLDDRFEEDVDSFVNGLDHDLDNLRITGRRTTIFAEDAPSEDEVDQEIGYSTHQRDSERNEATYHVTGSWFEEE